MDGEFTIVRLAKAILESESYEEFMLRCGADEEVTNLLEYMSEHVADPTSPQELYSSMKESFESRPNSELKKALDQRESEFKEAFRGPKPSGA